MNTLSGLVQNHMGQQLRLGDVFIFINGSENTMKLIHAEDGGLVMYVKRLEDGTFRIPKFDADSKSYTMEWRDLVMMIEGIKDSPDQHLRRLKTNRY